MTKGQFLTICKIERELGVKYKPGTDTPESFLGYWNRPAASEGFTRPAQAMKYRQIRLENLRK